MMELASGKKKDLDFKNDNDGWKSHSQNAMFASRCRAFVENECANHFDVEVRDEKDKKKRHVEHFSKRQQAMKDDGF